MSYLKSWLFVVTISLMGTVGAWAGMASPQEHPMPEHPQKTSKATASISMSTLEKAIQDQIAEKAKANSGKFPLRDDTLNKTWRLELVKVHTDKLAQLDDKTYFACVDMKADDGTIVDVDFFMKDDNGKLTLSDTTVHKINGKPRYTWQKKGAFWERVPVSK